MGEATRRKKQRDAEFQQADQRFRSVGIDTTRPGFYDQSAFLNQEKANPEYLKLCTRWLARRPLSEGYRRRAERVVPAVAESVAEMFVGSEMVASCMNGSAMLSRVLERAGIWNHVIHGSLVLTVPREGVWRAFQTVDHRDFPGAVCGHAWVFAPPFHVVDVTIALQRWDDEARPFVPAKVLTTFTSRVQVEIEDVVAARLRPQLRGSPLWGKRELVYEAEPELREMEGYVPAMDLRVGEAQLRYVPVATRLPDTDLEAMNTMSGCTGPTGAEVWRHCAVLINTLAAEE
jgi:hypothetical protein